LILWVCFDIFFYFIILCEKAFMVEFLDVSWLLEIVIFQLRWTNLLLLCLLSVSWWQKLAHIFHGVIKFCLVDIYFFIRIIDDDGFTLVIISSSIFLLSSYRSMILSLTCFSFSRCIQSFGWSSIWRCFCLLLSSFGTFSAAAWGPLQAINEVLLFLIKLCLLNNRIIIFLCLLKTLIEDRLGLLLVQIVHELAQLTIKNTIKAFNSALCNDLT